MPQGILNSFLGPSGPTFLPTDIAGLIRWYDADYYTGSYANNDPITTFWDDFSTSAENATPEVGLGPFFRNNVLTSGKSSVYFSDGFRHFDTTEMTLGNYSVVVLFKPVGDSIVASSPSGNYQVREQVGGSLAERPVLFHDDGITLDFDGFNDTNIWHVRSWTRDGTSGVPFFYWNKTQEAEKDGQTSTASMKISTVGLFNGGPADFHLAEMLIYNTVLTQADIDNLHDFYFALKYPGDL